MYVPVALKIWTFGQNVLFWGTGADWTSGLRKISDGHNGPYGPNGPSGPSVPVSPGPGTYIPTRYIWSQMFMGQPNNGPNVHLTSKCPSVPLKCPCGPQNLDFWPKCTFLGDWSGLDFWT